MPANALNNSFSNKLILNHTTNITDQTYGTKTIADFVIVNSLNTQNKRFHNKSYMHATKTNCPIN